MTPPAAGFAHSVIFAHAAPPPVPASPAEGQAAGRGQPAGAPLNPKPGTTGRYLAHSGLNICYAPATN